MTTPANLGEVLDITSGFAFSSKNFSESTGTPIIRIRDVARGRTDLKFDGDYDPRYLVDDGDLLISMDGEFRLAEWRGGKALLNQRVCRVEPKDERVDRSFLKHFLPKKLKEIEDQTPFVTVKHLSVKSIRAIELPDIPNSEQRRIAAILDKADAIRRKREQALALADEFLKSVFLEMFGDPVTNPNNFPELPLEDIADITSGLTKGRRIKDAQSLREVPYMRVANVQDGHLNLNEIKGIEATESEIEKFLLQDGDLLLTEGGDPDKLGRGCVWNGEVEECIHQNHIFRVRLVSEEIDPYILQLQIGSQRGKRYFLKSAKQTTGIASINKKQLSAYPVLMPPIELQKEYLRIFSKFQLTLKKIERNLAESFDLFSSLSQRAFRGEL